MNRDNALFRFFAHTVSGIPYIFSAFGVLPPLWSRAAKKPSAVATLFIMASNDAVVVIVVAAVANRFIVVTMRTANRGLWWRWVWK
jgi:hypothetical protein